MVRDRMCRFWKFTVLGSFIGGWSLAFFPALIPPTVCFCFRSPPPLLFGRTTAPFCKLSSDPCYSLFLWILILSNRIASEHLLCLDSMTHGRVERETFLLSSFLKDICWETISFQWLIVDWTKREDDNTAFCMHSFIETRTAEKRVTFLSSLIQMSDLHSVVEEDRTSNTLERSQTPYFRFEHGEEPRSFPVSSDEIPSDVESAETVEDLFEELQLKKKIDDSSRDDDYDQRTFTMQWRRMQLCSRRFYGVALTLKIVGLKRLERTAMIFDWFVGCSFFPRDESSTTTTLQFGGK